MAGSINYDGISITKKLLFGTDQVPDDFNERIPEPDAAVPVVTYDANMFLESGPGRFAWPARANIVEFFFTRQEYEAIPSGSYSLQELVALLEADFEYVFRTGDLFIPIENYGTDVNSADYEERAYIFGSSGASLESATFHVSENGTRTISNIVVQPDVDNFNFETVNDVAQLLNDTILKPILDPYGLGQNEVAMQFTQASPLVFQSSSGTTSIYDQDMYFSDKDKQAELVGSTTAGLVLNSFDEAGYLFNYLRSDPILVYQEEGYYGDQKSVKYLDSRGVSLEANGGGQILVGNTLSNEILAGAGLSNIEVYAGAGDDVVIIGSKGAQYIDGYTGFDTVSYEEFGDLGPGIIAFLRAPSATSAPELLVTASGAINRSDMIHNVERVVGTNTIDRLVLQGDLAELSGFEGFDALAESAQSQVDAQIGDQIDIRELAGTQEVIIDLEAGWVSQDGITLDMLLNFESVLGRDDNDVVLEPDSKLSQT